MREASCVPASRVLIGARWRGLCRGVAWRLLRRRSDAVLFPVGIMVLLGLLAGGAWDGGVALRKWAAAHGAAALLLSVLVNGAVGLGLGRMAGNAARRDAAMDWLRVLPLSPRDWRRALWMDAMGMAVLTGAMASGFLAIFFAGFLTGVAGWGAGLSVMPVLFACLPVGVARGLAGGARREEGPREEGPREEVPGEGARRESGDAPRRSAVIGPAWGGGRRCVGWCWRGRSGWACGGCGCWPGGPGWGRGWPEGRCWRRRWERRRCAGMPPWPS